MPQSFYRYSYRDLQETCHAFGLIPESANMLFNWYYKRNQRLKVNYHNLPKKTARFIDEELQFHLPRLHTVREAADKTVKFLFELQDGGKVETVLIPFQGKYTACLSSQVGCAMNCSFCFTGTQGFTRHLEPEEIVGQFLEAQAWLTRHRPHEARVLNIVYMGQGEPLHNFDAVKKSAEIFLSQHGVSVAAHKITVSTAGYVPGLKRWKSEMPDVNIALSLHAACDEKRSQLIPINRRFPLAEVLPLVDSIPTAPKRFVTYEYMLIEDFNDGPEDAHATGRLLRDKKAYLNLIPFNPFPGSRYRRPARARIEAFKAIVESYRVPALIRTTKGEDILAACGQLNTASVSF